MTQRGSPEHRRSEIVHCLRLVMAERGYEDASVKRIAAAAGLNQGLVHYHFGNKHEVLLALCDLLIEGAWARIDSRTSTASTPRERLGATIDGLLGTGPDVHISTVRCWAFLGSEALKSDDVAAIYQSYVSALASRFRTAMREVLVDEQRSQRELGAMAAGLVATVEGFIRVSTAAPGTVPAGSAAATTRRMAYGLIDAQPRQRA